MMKIIFSHRLLFYLIIKLMLFHTMFQLSIYLLPKQLIITSQWIFLIVNHLTTEIYTIKHSPQLAVTEDEYWLLVQQQPVNSLNPWRQQRGSLPSCLLVIALMPSNAPVEIYNFLIGGLYGENALVPLPFQNKHIGLRWALKHSRWKTLSSKLTNHLKMYTCTSIQQIIITWRQSQFVSSQQKYEMVSK